MFVESWQNAAYIERWNEILTPEWLRFRHLVSSNAQIHSDLAYPRLSIRRGQRVLDVACGFGETTLDLADRVGPLGSVLGLDCTSSFIDIAEHEREISGVSNVEYWLADIEHVQLPAGGFDAAVSCFGIIFCRSPVRALRAIARALVPGGVLGLICWRSVAHNPCWGLAERVALRYLPPPSEPAPMCGPGPFSMADRETDERILRAAGFEDVRIVQQDAELCVGRSLAEAVDYQMLGPAGYVIREAGERGTQAAPAIRAELARVFQPHLRSDGSLWLGSSTWFLRARTPLD